jgi:hypothetical protein
MATAWPNNWNACCRSTPAGSSRSPLSDTRWAA